MRHSYDCPADVAATFAVLSSDAWAHRKAEVLRDGSRVVHREEGPDGGVRLAVSRELPAGVPGFLQRFLPPDNRVLQSDEWGPERPDGSRHATWTADIPGAPASVGGAMRLVPADAGCTYVVEGTVSVSVPLVGGRAEKFLRDMLGRLLDKEADVLRTMVSGT